MSGRISVAPQSLIPAYRAGVVRTYVLSRDAGTGYPRYLWAPHIKLISTSRREGPEPGSAQFAYTFDDIKTLQYGWPHRLEQVVGQQASNPYLISTAVRLVSLYHGAGGLNHLLFDGYVKAFQGDLGPEVEQATFEAHGYPCLEWNDVLGGQVMRDMADPTQPEDANGLPNDYQTDIPARFNPDGQPNCSPEDADSGQLSAEELAAGKQAFTYPVFVDPLVIRNPDTRRKWTLGRAARYILRVGNPAQEHVRYGVIWPLLESILAEKIPKPGVVFDLDDPATYKLEAIEASDLDITGMAWPEALHRLIAPHGYAFCFRYAMRSPGRDDNDEPMPVMPAWELDIYKKQRDYPAGLFRLAPAPHAFNPALDNVGGLRISLDGSQIINDWGVMTEETHYQATFVLAPAFEIESTDADADQLARWDPADTANYAPEDAPKYRDFVLDETGEGHTTFSVGGTLEQWSTEATSLDALFGDHETTPIVGAAEGQAKEDGHKHLKRRRVPYRDLVSREAPTPDDPKGRPLQAMLWISTNYPIDKAPELYDPDRQADDGSDVIWRRVTSGNWELLHDRIGIRITEPNPNEWGIGKPASESTDLPFDDGTVPVIECLVRRDPGLRLPPFVLALTCVVRGDCGLVADVGVSGSSPVRRITRRRDDTRDRFRRKIITGRTIGLNETGQDRIDHDDTEKARTHAKGRRAAAELPRIGGQVVVPRLTFAYGIGQRVAGIAGRNLSFRVERPTPSARPAALRYPVIVGVEMSFEGGFSTTYLLDDRRGEEEGISPVPQPVVKERVRNAIWQPGGGAPVLPAVPLGQPARPGGMRVDAGGRLAPRAPGEALPAPTPPARTAVPSRPGGMRVDAGGRLVPRAPGEALPPPAGRPARTAIPAKPGGMRVDERGNLVPRGLGEPLADNGPVRGTGVGGGRPQVADSGPVRGTGVGGGRPRGLA